MVAVKGARSVSVQAGAMDRAVLGRSVTRRRLLPEPAPSGSVVFGTPLGSRGINPDFGSRRACRRELRRPVLHVGRRGAGTGRGRRGQRMDPRLLAEGDP